MMTLLGLQKHSQGVQCFSNYHTTYSQPWDPRKTPPGTGFLLQLDEAGVVADGRMHASEFNIHFGQWLVQVRKIDSDLVYTCQFADQPDLRLRRLTDMWMEARGLTHWGQWVGRDWIGCPAQLSKKGKHCICIKEDKAPYPIGNFLVNGRPMRQSLHVAMKNYDTNEIVKRPEKQEPTSEEVAAKALAKAKRKLGLD